MAVIRFKDGNSRYVSYSQGARIYQVLIGNEQPENHEQAMFIRTVESVEMPQLPMPVSKSKYKPIDPEVSAERKRKIREILIDPTIRGKQKYYAIGEVLYGRNIAPRQDQQQLV